MRLSRSFCLLLPNVFLGLCVPSHSLAVSAQIDPVLAVYTAESGLDFAPYHLQSAITNLQSQHGQLRILRTSTDHETPAYAINSNGGLGKVKLVRADRKRLPPFLEEYKRHLAGVARIEIGGTHPCSNCVKGTAFPVQPLGRFITAFHVVKEAVTTKSQGKQFAIRSNADFRLRFTLPGLWENEPPSMKFDGPARIEMLDADKDLAVLFFPQFQTMRDLTFKLEGRECGKTAVVPGFPSQSRKMGLTTFRSYSGRLRPGELHVGPGSVKWTGGCGYNPRISTSLVGGNSGSPIVDIENGRVLGMHQCSSKRGYNIALGYREIRETLTQDPPPMVINRQSEGDCKRRKSS